MCFGALLNCLALLYALTRICSVGYIKRVESVFEIIAEPNRRAILSLLVSSQQSVGEIERQLRMPQPTVSKHLRVLREAGFVESTVDAQRRLYRLKPEPLQEVDAWLAPFRRFWSAHIDALERHLDRMDRTKEHQSTPTTKTRTEQRRNEMKIKVTSLYVDDQDKALRFYTEVLGFAKKSDFSNGPFRWLTVASPEEPEGTELQLALNNNPAAKAYQQAIFQQSQPAAMFFTDDVKGDYERIKAHGAEFTMPPTDVTASIIAVLNDTCGNLIQLTAAGALLTMLLTKEKKVTDREQYIPGPANGAQVRKDGEKWTLILVRELRHSPEKVWQALTDPAQLREWAPFDADGNLGTVGTTVKLTWVGTPQRRCETTSDARRRSQGA